MAVDSHLMPGKILELRIKRAKSEMEKRDELEFVSGSGIKDDMYFNDGGRKNRQVLLLDKRSLEDFGYSPGLLREQVLVDFDGLQELPVGSLVRLGDAELEITMDCAPCRTMAGYLGEEPQKFVNKMMGRRGMLAKVVKSGTAKVGDEVHVGS